MERPGVVTPEKIEAALGEVTFPGGIAASSAAGRFGLSRFTRDYLVVAGDLMTSHPLLARGAFSDIAEDQGSTSDPVTEEQPGRLPHQVVRPRWDDVVVSEDGLADHHHWAQRWGVPVVDGGFTVYNATDGPRYLVELDRFCRLHSRDVLNDTFVHRATGETRTVAEAASHLLDWMTSAIARSEDAGAGVLEVACTNPRQTSWSGVMRDGADSYFHPLGEGGTGVNRGDAVAFVEVQGLAVAALAAGIRLFDNDPRTDEWRRLLSVMPQRTVDLFECAGDLASAVDRDAAGLPRPVALLGSASLELLAVPELLSALPDAPERVAAMVTRAFSADSLTSVGVRTLGLTYAPYEGEYWSYQGARTVWPAITRQISRGLREWDLGPLADELGRRLLAGLTAAGDFVEFLNVDEKGEVNTEPFALSGGGHAIAAPDLPARTTAWTVSAAAAELAATTAESPPPAADTWQADLCARILGTIDTTQTVTSGYFSIDLERGRRLRRERLAVLGIPAFD